MKCPICHKKVARANPEFPFCSERCSTIDLGNWASGKYVISTPIHPPSGLEETAEENDED